MDDYKISNKEWQMIKYQKKLDQARADNRYYCRYCNHSVTISPKTLKVMCSFCGHWVYKNKKDEFMDRLKGALK